MAFTKQQLENINLSWEGFLMKRRPPPEIRDKVDLGMKIDGQAIIIHEIRPYYNDPGKIIHSPIAKTIYVQSSDKWKIYWMRGNLKWYPYDPQKVVNSFNDFLIEVDNDSNYCFWG